MVKLPPVTPEVKPIAHLLKLAEEHENRNIVIAYWARMGACNFAMKLVPGKKSPETAALLKSILDWLEVTKKENLDNDGITNQITAQAMVEDYGLRLFDHADQLDRDAVFNKNTVKTFYTAGIVMDILDQFESFDPQFREKRKYAKWKASYIHNCLKNGEVPISGRRLDDDDDDVTIMHKNLIGEDDLKNYTRYVEPGSDTSTSANVPVDPNTMNLGNFGIPQIPSNSPITPVIPTNPTPFNTPNPQATPSVTPSITPSVGPSIKPTSPSTSNGASNVDPEGVQKAQKYCKYAASALNYDDVKNAVDYLTKALNLLQTGKEGPEE